MRPVLPGKDTNSILFPYFCSMMKIGLLSDTHSSLHPRLYEFFADSDEIWHAGDIGDLQTYEQLASFRPVRAVHGNIDGHEIRLLCPEFLDFRAERVDVLITHIGGYPGRYDWRARQKITEMKPKLFICGHSHILKVIYDQKYKMLVVNPGAAGNSGFHRSITMVRFVIDGEQIKDMEVMDIKR